MFWPNLALPSMLPSILCSVDTRYLNNRGWSNKHSLWDLYFLQILPGAGLISGCFEITWLTFPLRLVVRSQDVFSSSRSWHSWIVDLPYRTVGVDEKDKSHMALRCQRSGGQAQQSHPTVEATRDCYSFAQLMILDDAHIQ